MPHAAAACQLCHVPAAGTRASKQQCTRPVNSPLMTVLSTSCTRARQHAHQQLIHGGAVDILHVSPCAQFTLHRSQQTVTGPPTGPASHSARTPASELGMHRGASCTGAVRLALNSTHETHRHETTRGPSSRTRRLMPHPPLRVHRPSSAQLQAPGSCAPDQVFGGDLGGAHCSAEQRRPRYEDAPARGPTQSAHRTWTARGRQSSSDPSNVNNSSPVSGSE